MRSESSRASRRSISGSRSVQLVVDRRPAVARGKDDASLRPSGQPRDELAHGPDDRVHVVGLYVDRAEGGLARRADVALEAVDPCGEEARDLREARPDPRVAGLVGRLDDDLARHPPRGPARRPLGAPRRWAPRPSGCGASWRNPTQPREERVRCQVRVLAEALPSRARLLDRGGPSVQVERRHGLPEGEVARRPGARPPEVAGEEPVRRPLADAGQGGELGLDLVVRERGERVEVDRGAGDRDGVLRLPRREAEGAEVVRARGGEALAGRERVRERVPLAVALDQAPADRERGPQRDLLCGDRGDERLPGVGGERRSEAGKIADEPCRAPDPPSLRTRRTREGRTRRRACAGRRPRRRPARAARRRTPPGASPIAISRPSSTRWSRPSCQRFAGSRPKMRYRSVVSSKLNGCGIATSTAQAYGGRTRPDTAAARTDVPDRTRFRVAFVARATESADAGASPHR